KGVEPLHLCVQRQDDGTYWLMDNGSRTGTFVNEVQVREAVLLKDGDVLRLGANKVRFNERVRQAGSRQSRPPVSPSLQARPVPQGQQVKQAIALAFAPAPVGQPVTAQPVVVAPAPRPVPVAVPLPASPAPRAPDTRPMPVVHAPTQV